jgi:ribonuclease T1
MGLAKKSALFVFLSLFLSGLPLTAQARSHHSHDATVTTTIAVAELPPEARKTLQLIKNNGPFPYPRDGVVFGNYEHVLPQQARGHYHEYTVKTPGVHGRGARRVVCGVVPECYYSDDHYQSFKRIKEESR